MSGTSTRQVVTRGVEENLFLRVQDHVTNKPLTVAGSLHTIKLYAPSGAFVEEIASPSAFSVSDTNLLTLKHTFQESLYPLKDYYKALWTVHLSGSGGGATFKEVVAYFSVVRRRFASQLSVAEMAARHPYLSPQLPQNHSLETFLQRAWEKITLTLWKRLETYAGNVFHPEDFTLAHEYLTLAEFFLSIAFSADPRDEDMKKHELYTQKGLDALEVAAAKIAVDLNQDGIFAGREQRFLSSIRAVR